jgi:hypothetical protein
LPEISTFSPPIMATRISDNLPRIVVAVGMTDELPFLLAVDMGGHLEFLPIDEVLVDWRYDPKTEIWDNIRSTTQSPFGGEDG